MKKRTVKLPFSIKQKGGSFKILTDSDNMVSFIKSMMFPMEKNPNNYSNTNTNYLNNSNNSKINFIKASETKEYYKNLPKKYQKIK